MNLTEIAEKLQRVDDAYHKEFNISPAENDWFLLKLQEELGELTQAYLNTTGRNRRSPESEEQGKRALAQEIADVTSYLLLFAERIDIDVEKAIQEKWFTYLHE
ncbi:MAG: pyrophosphatase [Patescibacteria group bacterium]|jgi:NTP pyrophosphatase (non-canonical NTP hydrolase)